MSMLKRLLPFAVLAGAGPLFAWPTCRPEIVCEFNPASVAHIVSESPDFAYDGSDWTGLSAWTDRTMPVKGGACLRADIAWRKRVWNFGSVFHLVLRFEDAKGRVVREQRIDATQMKESFYPMTESESLCAMNGERIEYFSYFLAPSNAVAMRTGVFFRGNPATVRIEELTFQYADAAAKPWFSQPPRGRQIDYPVPTLTDAELAERLKKRPLAKPEIVRNGDRMELRIDGRRVRPATRHCQRHGHAHGIQEFAKVGYEIVNVNVVFGEHTYVDAQPQVWKEDDTLDIGLLERTTYDALRENPDGYVFLVCKVCAPRCWKMRNLRELERNHRGEYRIFCGTTFTDRYSTVYPDKPGSGWVPSLYSRKYLADVGAKLEEAFRRFEATPAARAVVGVYIVGGDDCQFRTQKDPWNSANAQEDFRQWLKDEYGDDRGLAAAWHEPCARIADVIVPTEQELNPPRDLNDVAGRGRSSDFRRFSSFANHRSHAAMRSAVKRGAPRLLVGGYDVAKTLSGAEGRGRHMQELVLSDPGYDFVIWLPGYTRRRGDVVLPFDMGSYNGSAVLHGKMLVTELDVRNPLQPDLWYGMYPTRMWQHQHDSKTFADFLNLATASAVAWGGAWHQYALVWDWYDTKSAMEAIDRAGAIADAAEGHPYSRSRLAVFFDERMTDFFSRSSQNGISEKPTLYTYPVEDAAFQCGVRFDNYLIDDVFHPEFRKEAPKVMVLANLVTLSASAIRRIRTTYLKDGRTLVWLGAPGIFSGASESEMSKVFGITVRKTDMQCPLVTVGNDPLVRGVEGFWNGNTCRQRLNVYTHSYVYGAGAGWEPLAEYAGTDACGAVVRRTGDSREILIGSTGAIRGDLLRNIARESGIRPSTETWDSFTTGASLAVLGATSCGGFKCIWYPEGVRSMEVLTGQRVVSRTKDYLEIYLPYRESAVFKLHYE